MFTRRSFSAFGTAVAGLSVILLGIRIAGRDRQKGPEMSRIDPRLDYRFFLTFKGVEQEIRDISVMEEVLTAFDLGREAWSLKIEPPMGTLAQWRGYYDDREGADTYVTEIALAGAEGIQRWALRFDCDYVPILHRELKKVIVEKIQATGKRIATISSFVPGMVVFFEL